MQTDIHSYPDDSRIPIGEAARLLGVAVNTLRRWESEGKISSTRTPGNQRRYSSKDVEALASSGHSPAGPTKAAQAKEAAS